MKYEKSVSLYRKCTNQSKDARFIFESVLEQLGVPKDQWKDIHTLELKVTDYVKNPSTIQSH